MPAELIDGETEELRNVTRRRRGQTVHREHVAGLKSTDDTGACSTCARKAAPCMAPRIPVGHSTQPERADRDRALQSPWSIGVKCRLSASG